MIALSLCRVNGVNDGAGFTAYRRGKAWLASERGRPQVFEAIEVSVQGQEIERSMLQADRRDLGVERQVAAGVALAQKAEEDRGMARPRREDLEVGAREETLQGTERLSERGGWVEHLGMGDDAHELGDAKDRQRPREAALHELA